nr:MAG TPA: major capsid protein [Caudoviricetes sp.]
MPNVQPDFSGWATVYDRKCTDGRTIKRGAFDDMDGQKVPLVWQHQHDDPDNVLGYAILHADEQGRGMRTDGYLNDTPKANNVRKILEHGDIDSLSIYANKLTENSRKEVMHGTIKEVSIVMFGANSDARVDYTSLHHSEMSLEDLYSDAIIYNGVHFEHSEETEDTPDETSIFDGVDLDNLDLSSLTDEELESVAQYLASLSHAEEEEDETYGIESAQDLIDAYSALPEDEMNLMNRFMIHLGKKEQVPEDLIQSISAMIDSKDEATKVKLLTMLSLASDQEE